MITHKIWRAFNDPPTLHPLFWKTIYRSGATQFASRDYRIDSFAERGILFYLLGLFIIWLLESYTHGAGQIFFLNLMFFMLVFPVLLLVGFILRYTILNGTINGLFWALRISHYVANEREHGGFELVGVAPPGTLGALMAVCTGCLYRKATLHQFRIQYRFVISLVFLIGSLIALAVNADLAPYTSAKLVTFIAVLALVLALYIDAIHSTILGSLTGMLVPTYTRNRLDARVWTIGVYLSLQTMTFVSSLLIGLLLPGLYRVFQWNGWFADLSPIPIGVLFFFLIREGLIMFLWRLLARQLNADPHEMRFWP